MDDHERIEWLFKHSTELTAARPEKGQRYSVAFFAGSDRLEASGDTAREAVDVAVVMLGSRSR